MTSKMSTALQGFAMVLAFSAFGCGPSPEKVGDPCEPDGDPCPSGSMCLPGGEDHTCQAPIPAGGACNPAQTPENCEGDLICGKNPDGTGTCGIAEGGTCD